MRSGRGLNRATLRAALTRWRADPVAFCVEVLGFEPWWAQAELIRAVAAHAFVSCRSGHKCGKTTALAAIALWWIVCHERSRVVCTAPAEAQIEKGVWFEVKRLYRDAERRGFPLGGEINETSRAGLHFADGRDVFGRSTTTKENFAGISAPRLLILVDEASGIDEAIFEAIFGNAASGGHVAMISNPTRTSGTFYESHHAKRANWVTLHISSEDAAALPTRIPGLATREWLAWAKAEWGFPSAFYDVRARGEFPSEAENTVIGLQLVLDATERGRLVDLATVADPLTLGVDVARFGDDESVVTPVRRAVLFPQRAFRNLDSGALAGAALAYARELARFDEVPEFNIDVIGVGSGVYDRLAEAEHARAFAVNVSERASDTTKYPTLRSELWFGMRDWLRAGGALAAGDGPDAATSLDRLAAELIAPTYTFDGKGRACVEPKDRIKERLRRSPDRADSACLGVYRAEHRGSADDLERIRAQLPGRCL